jgi:hypothetical protein
MNPEHDWSEIMCGERLNGCALSWRLSQPASFRSNAERSVRTSLRQSWQGVFSGWLEAKILSAALEFVHKLTARGCVK